MTGRAKAVLTSGGFWAVVASGAGVSLGLLREILVIRMLGWTSVNDRLQIYLSVIYGVSLANEAVRLACLNLLQRNSLVRTAGRILPLGAVFSVVSAGWMWFQLKPDSGTLVAGACVSGFLNMVMVLLVTARQRGGSFWSAHLINLLPNVLLIPGIVWLGFMGLSDPVPALAWMYFALPAVQILLLLFVRQGETAASDAADGEEAKGLFLSHSSSALGNLLFQGVLRQTGLATSQGVLAQLSIAIRVYDSIRFVVIDTVIGRKLAGWKESSGLDKVAYWTGRLVFPQVTACVVGLVVAALVHGSVGALVVLAMSVGSFGLRLVYFMVNSRAVSTKLAWTYGTQDILAACAMYLLAFTPFGFPAMLVWVWYMAKPLVQLFSVASFLIRRKVPE